MMQTRDKLDPLSMWYSSSARMKASGVSTFSSTLLDWIPVSEVTWKKVEVNFSLSRKYHSTANEARTFSVLHISAIDLAVL